MKKTALVLICAGFLFFGWNTTVNAATNVYYSVGQNTTDHKTGTPTLTISGGVGTFSVGQTATNLGVGDKVTFNTSSVCYISSKQSTSIWNLITATGTTCPDVTDATVDSIAHAFASLNAAVGGASPGAAGASFLNTSDLTVGNHVLNIPLYYDTGADAPNLTISGFTTGVNNYIKIYTPYNTSTEVNQAQRHSGKWDTTKWHHSMSFGFGYTFIISISYVRMEGLQFRNTHASGAGIINYLPTVTSNTDSVYLSNSIFYNTDNAANNAINFPSLTSSSGTKNVYIWNNLIQGFANGISISNNWLTGIFRIYNNTFYNLSTTGINVPGFGTAQEFYLINNLFASSTAAIGGIVDGGANGSDNNATDLSSLGYTVSGGGNDNDRVSQTFTFADTANNDFHLLSSDAGARDFGANLSGDLNLPITSDLEGGSRPYNSVFDIGADEYDGLYGDSTPPVRSSGLPVTAQSVGTTQTTISLTTSENATCKYSTTAGTAYSSMSDTFSTTGGTNHSTTVTGLSDGNRFHYYVRCQDANTNANTDDYEINFWVGGDTYYAESCSRNDVQAAITASLAGDTVSIPTGTCTGWTSASALAVNKAITVQGAGTGQTILQIADDSGSYVSPVIAITAAATVKNMTIQTGTTGNSGTAFGGTANGFRISNIEYINQSANSNGYFVYFSAYGLIDNSDITGGAGNNELIFGRGPTDSWQTANSLGTTDNLIVEGNTFRGTGYVSDCNSNSRCVFRNNTITGAMKIDGHGLASNTPARGVRHMEVYNNTWTLSGTQTAMELRGGTGMIFNNIGTNSGLKLHEYGATATWSNFGNVIQTVDDYPITDQIGVGMDPKVAASEPMYLWSNRNSGSIWQISLGYGNDAQLSPIIVSDRDYYNEAVSFNGTSGVGSGTLASRPATCTTGVGYFATDQGSNWDIGNATASDGSLYKCTSTNTWTESYTPYAYPHYLAATSTSGTNGVDTGIGARMFGNGKFYGISTTTPSGTVADITITPGSNADSWVDVDISTWSNTGTRHKVWTESMPHLRTTNTVHVVGNLSANTEYNVKVDNVLGANITGASCTGGVCTSDANGRITFTYSGGYSEHEFDVEETGIPDTTSPTNSGTITTASVTSTTLTLNWTKASDETSAQGALVYRVYRSSSNNINSVANIFANGTAVNASTTDINTLAVTGLSSATTYYFNIVVADEAGNSAVYTTKSETTSVSSTPTPAPTPTPSVGGGGGPMGLISQLPNTNNLSPNNTVTIASLQNQITQLTLQLNALLSQTNSTTYTPYNFTRDLYYRMVGNDVLHLQQYLNTHGYVITTTGLGSPGNETTKFGLLTYKALQKFQKSVGLPATGFFGPQTRNYINKK